MNLSKKHLAIGGVALAFGVAAGAFLVDLSRVVDASSLGDTIRLTGARIAHIKIEDSGKTYLRVAYARHLSPKQMEAVTCICEVAVDADSARPLVLVPGGYARREVNGAVNPKTVTEIEGDGPDPAGIRPECRQIVREANDALAKNRGLRGLLGMFFS